MVTNRFYRRQPRRLSLNHWQELDLWLGTNLARPAFPSDAARRAAWFRHRDHLMAVCCDAPGARCDAWWSYESPVPRPRDDAYCAAALWEANALGDIERGELEKIWRGYFETAQRRDFAFCAGSHWLHGAAARRAHYAWAGISKPLVKRWASERRRNMRAIKRLEAEGGAPARGHGDPETGADTTYRP
jgi:hypothetical protein